MIPELKRDIIASKLEKSGRYQLPKSEDFTSKSNLAGLRTIVIALKSSSSVEQNYA